jgi:hypothetical protein
MSTIAVCLVLVAIIAVWYLLPGWIAEFNRAPLELIDPTRCPRVRD